MSIMLFSKTRLMLQILANQEKIMAALADLQTAVSNLSTSVSNELAAIAAKLSAAGDSVSSDDVEAAVASLNTLKANLDAETATLVPAPPAPPAAQ